MNAPAIAAQLADIGAEARRLIDGHGAVYDIAVEFHDDTRAPLYLETCWIEDRAAKVKRMAAFLRRHGVRVVRLCPMGRRGVEYSYVLPRRAA